MELFLGFVMGFCFYGMLFYQTPLDKKNRADALTEELRKRGLK